MPVILREMTQFFPLTIDPKTFHCQITNPDFRDFFDQIHRTSFFRKKMKNDFVFLDFGNRGEDRNRILQLCRPGEIHSDSAVFAPTYFPKTFTLTLV